MFHTGTAVLLKFLRHSSYAMRARLALAVSGQVCELREMVLRAKPQGLLQVSPKATVPVLVLADGTVLEQSLDIMCWALAQNDPAGWLHPSQGDEADGAQARVQAVDWLQRLEALRIDQPSLFGNRAALADTAIAPFVRQFAGIDADWWAAQPRFQAWLAQWQATALFEGVMPKLNVWADGTIGVHFPFQQT